MVKRKADVYDAVGVGSRRVQCKLCVNEPMAISTFCKHLDTAHPHWKDEPEDNCDCDSEAALRQGISYSNVDDLPALRNQHPSGAGAATACRNSC